MQAYAPDEVYTIVRDIYNSTIFSDIVCRNQVKKIDQLERIVKYTFQNVGNTFSAKSIADYLKSERRAIDNETVYSYLEKLENAYLLHRCSRYDLRGREILKTQEKFYLADTALRYSVLGYNADSVAASLENIVYLELCRRRYTVQIGKTPDGEIDFVAVRQNEKLYTDREHIHNHIFYNSTALDSTRKFRDFLLSGLAVQRLSDLICLEHQLSVIEIKPYRERQKRTLYPPRESNRDKLCAVIDNILLNEKPASFEGFLQKLEQQGYEIKRGKYTSVKGTRQKRFIRFRTLGAGYSEDEIKAVIAGEAEHRPHQKQPPKEQPFHLLVDIQAKLSEGKSEGYARWAKRYNLKEMSKTLIFLQENKIGSIEEMQERVDAATAHYHELGDSIKVSEKRLAEIAVLKAHIINYAKTRPIYDAYRKTGYSKRFLEAHHTEITLHKAAKAAFDESNLKTLPKVKELDAEYSKLLTEKKAAYPDYRKAKEEMQELLRARRNVELFFAEEKDSTEKTKSR